MKFGGESGEGIGKELERRGWGVDLIQTLYMYV